jgi:hypothetical protein
VNSDQKKKLIFNGWGMFLVGVGTGRTSLHEILLYYLPLLTVYTISIVYCVIDIIILNTYNSMICGLYWIVVYIVRIVIVVSKIRLVFYYGSRPSICHGLSYYTNILTTLTQQHYCCRDTIYIRHYIGLLK